MNVFVKGNIKMGPEVLIFNLPPIKTYTPSKWCRENCYALMGNHRFPSVQQSWEKKISAFQTGKFHRISRKRIKKTKTALRPACIQLVIFTMSNM